MGHVLPVCPGCFWLNQLPLDYHQGKKVTVVGDLHGQLFDFDHMLSLAGEALESGPDDVGDIDAVVYQCC